MADDSHTWCAGLAVTRSRSLTVAESRKIWLRRRSSFAKAVGWLLGVPLVVIVCAAALTLSPPPDEALISIVVLLGLFVGVPLCIVMSNDYFKRASALRRQCRDSEVLVCEGAVADLVLERKGLENLRRQIGQSSRVVLEVLMDSSLVWAVNGHPQESWIVVPRGHTVGPPDQARLAAQYVRPVETEGGTFRLHQRRLSDGECSELRGYIPHIKLPAAIITVVMNTIAVAHLVAYVRRPLGVPLIGITVLIVAGWCDAQLALLVRARHRILRDLRERFVVIYQPDPAVDAPEQSVVEFLPHSRAEWATGGRAAPWRRSYGSTVS